MSNETNETYIKYIKLYETCKCKCRLDASFCNSKQLRMKVNAGVNVGN